MKIIATVEARLASTRLPGKSLKDLAGKTLLERVIDRLKLSKTISKIVVATTSLKEDDLIVDLCKKIKIDYFRGSAENVLERVYLSAKKYKADLIVQLGADCPFYDHSLIDLLVNIAMYGGYDYATNDMQLTFPEGIDAHIIPFKILEICHKEARRKIDREDVPRYIWDRPKRFKIFNFEAVKGSFLNKPEIRLTIDYPEDLELARRIYKYFRGKIFSTFDIIKLIDKNKNWLKINQNCRQKSAPYIKN